MTKEYRCESCQKSFTVADALEQHNRAKHPEIVNTSFATLSHKAKKKIVVSCVVVVILGLLSWLIIATESGSGRTYQQMSFPEVCTATGGMWMTMQPTKNFIPISTTACAGCMRRNSDHICDKETYLNTLK